MGGIFLRLVSYSFIFFYIRVQFIWGLLWWLSGRESTCQFKRYEFDPWVGKILWRRKWQPTSVFCLGNLMDRGAWRATVQGRGCKELDMT